MKITNDKFINTPNGKRINVIGNLYEIIDSNSVFINGKGYINGDTVWIFTGSNQPKQPNDYPCFWFENNKNIIFSNPTNEIKAMFNIDNIIDVSVENIIAKTKNNSEKLYDEEVINAINAASSVYKPEVKDTDDPWKKCIKTAILNKQTDINRYKNKIVSYTFANVKSSLDKETKMSVYYFNIWAELLGLNTIIILSNNGTDSVNPLPKPVVYNGETGVVSGLSKEELHKLIDEIF